MTPFKNKAILFGEVFFQTLICALAGFGGIMAAEMLMPHLSQPVDYFVVFVMLSGIITCVSVLWHSMFQHSLELYAIRHHTQVWPRAMATRRASDRRWWDGWMP